MCDTEANKHIIVSFIIYSTSSTHQAKQKETSIMKSKFKIYFSEKKISYIENLRIESLICFRYHHINNFSDFVPWKFHALLISLMSEWNTKMPQYFLAKSQHSVRNIL